MSTKDFACQMKAVVSDIRAKGNESIKCDNLIAYLTDVENSPEVEPTMMEIEKFRADLQNWVEVNKSAQQGSLEMFRSVIQAGQNAIKSAFLLNGASAVALIALIGHLAQFKPDKVALFSMCTLPFSFGVLAITVTSGLTYLSQWLYACQGKIAKKVGFWLNILCMLTGFSSYGFFTWGLFMVYEAFKKFA